MACVFRTNNYYYSQVFLEECKHVVEKNARAYCNDIEISSDSDDSDEENFN